ncbi:retrotransposon protein, putative, ty1-copia subclass [Tanacetum coccineum]
MVEVANGMCVRLVLIASGSFEEVCSRLEDLLILLPTLLSDKRVCIVKMICQKAWIRWALDSKRHGSGVLTLKVDMQSVLREVRFTVLDYEQNINYICPEFIRALVPYGLRIAPAAIIDRQLPFEYTITSRSTDVVVMAQPVQNINRSAFRSMFEREKLSGNNFNDWFRQLKLVLRVKKKMFVIEQPLPAVPAADSDAQMKGYVDQLECLGYILPQDLIVGLILNGLTKDFAGFVRNYNMYNLGKTIGGKIQKAKKKSLKAKGKGKANGKGNDKQVYILKPKNPKPSAKEHPTKGDTCHHCKEVGHWKRNYHVYLAELLKKKKASWLTSSSGTSQ